MARLFPALLAFVLAVAWVSPARAGYTHYWRWRAEPDPAKLEITLREMNQLAAARRAILMDGEGRIGEGASFRDVCPWGRPTADGGDGGAAPELPCILFNGIADHGHETFGFPLAPFPNDPKFSFVKTAQKPYDEVAAACLIVAHDHFPNEVLEISSDGEWPGDFLEGARLYEKVLGRTASDPLVPHDRGDEPAPPPAESLTPKQVALRWGIFGLLGLVVLGALLSRRR